MEVFEGAEFVRLRSLGHGGACYLHAAEDGRGVRLLDARRRAPPRYAAWAVERLRSGGGGSSRGGTARVLLRGAYGRYLGGPPDRPRLLVPCAAAAQRDRDGPEPRALMWSDVGTGAGAGVVLLHDAHGRFLRAGSRRLPFRAGVVVVDGGGGGLGPTMQWEVEVIPWSHGRPELPFPRDSEWAKKLFDWACAPLADLRRRVWRASRQREIRWVRADGSGKFSEEAWASFHYAGRSAILLRSRLAHLTLEFNRLTLCVRAGRHGKPTPLLTTLPLSRERLDIVLIRAGTRAADRLIFPDVHNEPAGAAKEDVPVFL